MSRNTVHVSGFPVGTRANELAPQFESIGQLVRIDIPQVVRFKATPFAFVEYETPGDAENAIRQCDGVPFEMNKSYVLKVQMARSKGRRDEPTPRDYVENRGTRDPRDMDPRQNRPRDRMRAYRDQDDRRSPRGNPRGRNVEPRRYDERLGAPQPYEPVLGTPVPFERKPREGPSRYQRTREPAQKVDYSDAAQSTAPKVPQIAQSNDSAAADNMGNESDGSDYDPHANITLSHKEESSVTGDTETASQQTVQPESDSQQGTESTEAHALAVNADGPPEQDAKPADASQPAEEVEVTTEQSAEAPTLPEEGDISDKRIDESTETVTNTAADASTEKAAADS